MSTKDSDSFRRLGTAFASGGDRYQRLRPGYPAGAVDWLVAGMPDGGRVIDVGAGTGKLTAALVARGFDVCAVDPSADMLAQLHQALPTVSTRIGTGESTNIDSGIADMVTFAQSWHWVEPAAGAAEIERILRPTGRVGWIWSFLDVRVPWVEELAEIWHTLGSSEAIDAASHRPELTPAFDEVETLSVDWQQPMSPIDLADLVTTRSYYLTASADSQRKIRERAAALLADRFPEAERIDLPYRTHCFRSRLVNR